MLASGQGFSALTGAAKGALSAIGSFVAANPIGSVVAVGAFALASVALVASSESQQRSLASLQKQLRATRADYAAMAMDVTAAARVVAASTGIGTADARAAGQTIAAAPNFAGDQAQLQGLIKTAGDLALVLGKDCARCSEDARRRAAGSRCGGATPG